VPPQETQPRLDGQLLGKYEQGEVPVQDLVLPSQQSTVAVQ
jgi:hypothetical protein